MSRTSRRLGGLTVIAESRDMYGDDFNLASSTVGRLPISTLDRTGNPDPAADIGRCCHKLFLGLPPNDRQNVEATVRLLRSNRHQKASHPAAGFEHSMLEGSRQASVEHNHVEVHTKPLPASGLA